MDSLSVGIPVPSINCDGETWTRVNTDPRDELFFPDALFLSGRGWPGSDWNGGRHQIGRVAAIRSECLAALRWNPHYERRQRDQSSTRPVHAELAKAIAGAVVVDVYTLVIAEPIEPGRDNLPIDYAIGLEAGLIQKLDPPWNRRGRKLLLDDIET